MTELSDSIEEKIGSPNLDYDLRLREVAAVFDESDRPFLTRRQVQSLLDGDFDKNTVQDRLDELIELDILESDEHKNGTIYWLYSEESDWPIPPDVEVESKNDEMTVSEFFDDRGVEICVYGIMAIMVGTIFVWGGGIFAAVDLVFADQFAQSIAAVGLLLMLGGWAFFAYGVYRYFSERE